MADSLPVSGSIRIRIHSLRPLIARLLGGAALLLALLFGLFAWIAVPGEGAAPRLAAEVVALVPDGPGRWTARVRIRREDGRPLTDALAARLQVQLDGYDPGLGAGQMIGALGAVRGERGEGSAEISLSGMDGWDRVQLGGILLRADRPHPLAALLLGRREPHWTRLGEIAPRTFTLRTPAPTPAPAGPVQGAHPDGARFMLK